MGKNRPTHGKRTLQELDLLDRFLFAEAAEKPEIMVPVLEIILGREIVLKHLPQAEREMRGAVWSKTVRMDVLSVDSEDTLYEVEVQKRNTGNLPRRSRAYNGYIDSRLLPPGNVDYNALNDVYVIIVAPFDLFGEGRYMHTFRMMGVETPGLELEDGATRIFLNTRGTNPDGVSGELVELLRYFEDSTEETARRATSERVRRIHAHVQKIKDDEEVGIRFMNAWEEKILDRQEAYEEGEASGKLAAIASLMKNRGWTCGEAMDALGIAEEKRAEYAEKAKASLP